MFKFGGLYKCVSTQHFVWGTRAVFETDGSADSSRQTLISMHCPPGKVIEVPRVGRMYEMQLVEAMPVEVNPEDMDAGGQPNPPPAPGPDNGNSSPRDPKTDAEGEPDPPTPGTTPEAQPGDSER